MLRNLAHLFTFKGRAGRLEFLVHSVSDIVILLVFGIAFASGTSNSPDETSRFLDQLNVVLFLIVFFGGMIAEVCVAVRRFHDLGKSGAYFFGTWVPLYNLYLLYLLFFQEGEQGENKYGPPTGRARRRDNAIPVATHSKDAQSTE